jgi:hypothetical protein
MASAAKIAANRQNARKSTGPRSRAGKARTRYNAFRHGLCSPVGHDDVALAQIRELADGFAPGTVDGREIEPAMFAAEAQVEILRVRRAKVDLVNRAADHLRDEDARDLPPGERAALAFAQKANTLAALDRYERRALARRNRALREVWMLQRVEAARHKKYAKQVGPPRPRRKRTRGMPFDHVLRLGLSDLMPPSQFKPNTTYYLPRRQWGPLESPVVTVHAAIDLGPDGDRGDLRLQIYDGSPHLQRNDECVMQTFTVARRPSPVGGFKWFIQCQHTQKMVRDLYLTRGQKYFWSRHALRLKYRSKSMPAEDRHWERCQQLMDQLGADNYDHLPSRPKYMHRRTYDWLCSEIQQKALLMNLAHVGGTPPVLRQVEDSWGNVHLEIDEPAIVQR